MSSKKIFLRKALPHAARLVFCILGFLMVSVGILGPGDRPVVHDRDAELKHELNEDGLEDLNAMILLPPSIEKHLNFIVISFYVAEDLPAMDSSGLLSSAGIDAFVQIDFAGNLKCKT